MTEVCKWSGETSELRVCLGGGLLGDETGLQGGFACLPAGSDPLLSKSKVGGCHWEDMYRE